MKLTNNHKIHINLSRVFVSDVFKIEHRYSYILKKTPRYSSTLMQTCADSYRITQFHIKT